MSVDAESKEPAGSSPSTTADAATKPATEDAGDTTPTSPPAPAKPRLKIGSQRGGNAAEANAPKAAPTKPGATVQPAAPPAGTDRKNYPPPNVRDQLPPELEKELEDAMAGQSLDDIIDSSGSAESATGEIAPETRLTCTVVSVHREDVFVDLGGRTQGLLPLKQFGEGKETTAPEVGSTVDVIVQRFNNEQGLYEVSLPTAAVDVGNWDEVEVGQIIEVNITGHNKGGLECQVAGIRGFIPMGQISIYRVEGAEEFVGQRLSCVITEANRERKNLVLSHRAVMERERKEQKEKLLAELKPGEIREGVVRSLQDFGAFVDLGGVDGLVHISQLSWDRIGHPSEVLSTGQKIKVRVEKVNQETGKIALVYRDLAENPWKNVESKYAVGSRVNGKVTKLMDFGAFVRLEPGVEGLIHISELGHGRVNRTADVLSEAQEVEAKVLSVDADKQRISLSLKALLPPPEKPAHADRGDSRGRREQQSPEPRKRRSRPEDKNLKGGLGGPTGGDQFGLKW